MEAKGVRDLVSLVSRALHEGDLSAARQACEQLEASNRREPGLPRQLAEICHQLGDSEAELQALARAAELYGENGQVIQAIGACKQILAIDPGNSVAQRRLEMLYVDGSPGLESVSSESLDQAVRCSDDDAPLDELLLTKVVPEAIHEEPDIDLSQDGVSRIPLDPGDSLQFETDAVRAFEMQSSPEISQPSPQQRLASTPLFGSLDSASMRRLIAKVGLVELAEGEVLFREGDRADTLYVVVEGAVVAIAEGSPRKKLAVLEESEFFGEIGLVTNQPRNATIEALVDTRLLAIDRAVIWDLIRSQPAVFKVLLRFLRERLVDRLARTGSLFANFPVEERAAVARQFRLLEVRNEGVLIEQDRPAPGLFILLSGSMRVIYMDGTGDKELANLAPGDIFGEMSLVRNRPTSAAVVASGKCWVLCLPEERFRGLAERHPELNEVLEELASSREQSNRKAQRSASQLRDNDLGGIRG
jgi:cAMP-dependent protein kinase regulator